MRKLIAAVVFFFASFVVSAQTDPLELVKDVSNKMLTTLQEQRTQIKGHPERIVAIVDKLLLPYVDVETMTRGVLGKNWNETTPEQRKRFTNELTVLVVRTYAAAFEQYTNQTVDFLKPTPIGSNGDKIEIKTLIKQTGAPSIPVNYRLMKKGDSWKVYDINVDGVSLVGSYRSQFGAQIAQKGIDKVTDAIAERNKAGNNK
jgi:phospholipid transport system substrate-binding protein